MSITASIATALMETGTARLPAELNITLSQLNSALLLTEFLDFLVYKNAQHHVSRQSSPWIFPGITLRDWSTAIPLVTPGAAQDPVHPNIQNCPKKRYDLKPIAGLALTINTQQTQSLLQHLYCLLLITKNIVCHLHQAKPYLVYLSGLFWWDLRNEQPQHFSCSLGRLPKILDSLRASVRRVPVILIDLILRRR